MAPAIACAQQNPASQPEELIVTATRSARSLDDVPASVSLIDAQKIEDSPAQSLDRILVRTPSIDLPNISSNQMHPTDGRIAMRGLGGIRALVMLDDVPINDAFFGYVQWSRVPLENIERVEVVRGGGAALWGNYAAGGVINVITRPPDTNEALIDAQAGSYGTYRFNGFGSWAVGDGSHVSVTGGTNHTDGFMQVEPEDQGPVNVPTSFTMHNATVRGDFAISDTLKARATLDYFDNDQQLITQLSRNNQTAGTYSGSLLKTLGGGGGLELNLFGSSSRFTTYNTGAFDGIPANEAEYVQNLHHTPVDDLGTSAIWSKEFGAGLLRSIEVGGDFHRIDGEDRAEIYDETGALVRVDVGSGKQRFVGAFAQASLRPTEPIEVLVSVRYQSFENYDAYDGTPGGLGHAPDSSEDSVDPRVSFRYAFSPRMALRAAVYTAFRAPNLDNLYRAFSVPSGIFYANPALVPEKLRGGEIGLDAHTDSVRLQATLYYNSIDDLITYRDLDDSELPPGFFFGSRNINAGKARAQGAELEADWKIAGPWSAAFGLTFADSQITENPLDPASVGQQIGGVPRGRANLALTYAGPRWRVTPQLRWIEKSYSDNDHTLPVDEQKVVDVAVNFAATRTVGVYMNIENLLDEHYIADNGGFNPPLRGTPFSVYLGARVSLR
ncbi:MAG TPA: TonB-dependent receptor [Gammaproteobacteria bacterium]|nr:TonB-dependent receptor [Gammaproteobacteria bacterium]